MSQVRLARMAKIALLSKGPACGTLDCAEDPHLDFVLTSAPKLGARRIDRTTYQFGHEGYLEIVEILRSMSYVSISRNFGMPLPNPSSLVWSDIMIGELGEDLGRRVVELLQPLFAEEGLGEIYSACLMGSLLKLAASDLHFR